MVPILNDELQLVIERIGPMAIKIRLVSQWVKGLLAIFNRVGELVIGGSVEDLSVSRWVGGALVGVSLVGSWWVGGRPAGGSVIVCSWSVVCRWSVVLQYAKL